MSDKVRITIEEDEAYPVYYVSKDPKGAHEIPIEKLEWIRKTEKEYEKMQDYLKKRSFVEE